MKSLQFSPATLHFWGSPPADLFTKEIAASFQGVLDKNLITDPADPMLGFVSASIDGRPWTDTMWTRDAGVFLRELVLWGDLGHACQVAQRLIDLVRENAEGYCTFPMYFKRGEPGSGSELDGTCTIIIGLVLLWERLPSGHVTREGIQRFLHGSESPVSYILDRLERYPLVPGSGEFGGGAGIEGEFYNVVQNGLAVYALHAAARLTGEAGGCLRGRCTRAAEQIAANMLRHLRGPDGAWLWAVDAESLQPDPAVLDDIFNQGFGGLNGVLSMWADVRGLRPLHSGWVGIPTCLRTFNALFETPKRRAMFEKYGIWTQFDRLWGGFFTSPSYGHCYATQAMLLMDELDMAGRAIEFLAQMTYEPLPGNKVTRESPYFFYERCYLPELLEAWPELSKPGNDMPGWIAAGLQGDHFDEGCGALNLVNVAEPLKIARLVLGIDDSAPAHPVWVPRLPPGWQGMRAENWPILTEQGLESVDLSCEREGDGLRIEMRCQERQVNMVQATAPGQPISIRLHK